MKTTIYLIRHGQPEWNVELRLDDRLREIDLGDWEGRLQAELDIEEPGDRPAGAY